MHIEKRPPPTGQSTDRTAFTNCGVQVSLLRSSGTQAVVFSKIACRVQVDQLAIRDTARLPLADGLPSNWGPCHGLWTVCAYTVPP